jgi:16S rRNA processing protein RimM
MIIFGMIIVGKFLSTHGLSGNIKLNSYCEEPESIFSLKLYESNGGPIVCKKVGNTSRKDVFLASIGGVKTIDEAKLYRNVEIFVKREELDETSGDEFYIEDLKNMKVIASDGEQGRVSDFRSRGRNGTMEILWESGKKEEMPFAEPYLRQIDRENSIIRVEKPTYI